MPDNLRVCGKCGLIAKNERDLELFGKSRTCHYGRKNICKACLNAWNRAHSNKYWLINKNDPVFRAKRKSLFQEWEKRNREERLRYSRERRVGSGGKTFYVKKRHWTGFCEICGKKVDKNLNYHEFDDLHNGIGIWVCGRCHRYCHGFDHLEYLGKYLRLKHEIGRQPLAEWLQEILDQAEANKIPVLIKSNLIWPDTFKHFPYGGSKSHGK